MIMKKFLKIFLILVVISLVLCSCFRIDRGSQDIETKQKETSNNVNENKTYKAYATKLVNGTEYRMSRSGQGKYGGLQQ